MEKNTDKIAIQSFTVLRAREWAKWASYRTSERSGGRERSEQSRASEQVSGASERANGRASGPVLQYVFLAVLDHSERFFWLSSLVDAFVRHKKRHNVYFSFYSVFLLPLCLPSRGFNILNRFQRVLSPPRPDRNTPVVAGTFFTHVRKRYVSVSQIYSHSEVSRFIVVSIP